MATTKARDAPTKGTHTMSGPNEKLPKKSAKSINTVPEATQRVEDPAELACVLARDPVTGKPIAVCGTSISPSEMREMLLAGKVAGQKADDLEEEDDADQEEQEDDVLDEPTDDGDLAGDDESDDASDEHGEE